MKKYKDHTLQEYLTVLSRKAPVPGGGSASALTAALGVALIMMVANYSRGKAIPKSIETKIKDLIRDCERIRRRLLKLVDLDAQAYMGVARSRKGTVQVRERALRKAADVPREVSRLCYQALALAPVLVKHGNPYLLSDIIVAAELLYAAFNAARVNVEVNG